jgi:hypothetical protein
VWSAVVALGLRAATTRRQDVRDSDPADFLAADHDWHGPPLLKDRGAAVTSRSWVRIHFYLAVEVVDDPVDRDPRGSVELGGVFSIFGQAGVGDLDNQTNVGRPVRGYGPVWLRGCTTRPG